MSEKIKYLYFGKIKNLDQYGIYAIKDNLVLARLKKIKVGRWSSWCLTEVTCGLIYFSAGCLEEIRDKIRELNSMDRCKK